MENNIEMLENIMKPYFDKKIEIDNKPANLENEKNDAANKIREMKSERVDRRRQLEVELENVRVRHKITVEDFKAKMEKEIEDYISKAMSSNQNLTTAYGPFVRKDLERGYNIQLQELENNFKDQEEALLTEISKLKKITEEEKTNKQNLEDIDKKSNYTRVDVRELVEIKDDIRKQLFAERKRLNFELKKLAPEKDAYNNYVQELKQYQLKLNEIVESLSNFKYEYNEQNQVVNNDEWKKLYQERIVISDKITDLTNSLVEKNSIIHKLNDVNKSLEKVEEYIKMTELTKEEIAVVMMSMTPWEKAEYDRRKSNSNNSTKKNEDLIEIDDNKQYKSEEKDGKIFVDDMENLIGVIFNDVVKTVSNLKSIKINGSKSKLSDNQGYISSKTNGKEYEQKGIITVDENVVKLPCGEYLNKNDIVEATERLYSKPKAITYIVKATGKAYNMSESGVKKIKSALKNCTTIELIKENKISKLDLLKVFGKKRTNDVMKQVEIGELKDSKLEEGDYINKNETIVAFKNLFVENKLEWLRNISEGLKDKKTKMVEKIQKKLDEIDTDYVELNEDYTIKQK